MNKLYAPILQNCLHIAIIGEQSNFLLKLPKTSFLAVRAHFSTFGKNEKMTPNFFDERSKSGLGFEFGQPQRKCQRRPTLQSMANPAVCSTWFVVFLVDGQINLYAGPT